MLRLLPPGCGLAASEPATNVDAGPELPILDRKLRQRLYRATRPELAVKFLARSLPMFGKKGPARVQSIDHIEVLKYKPGRRCVLRYDLHGRYRRSQHSTRLPR